MDPDVRAAEAADLDVVVDVLAESFCTDPVMLWAFEAPERKRRVAAMWRLMAKYGFLPAGASTVLPAGDGAALWMPPGRELDDAFWNEHGAEYVEWLEGDVGRTSELGEVMGERHPTEPHWYLMAIGVHPDAQGRGLGGTLLAHTLALADAAGEPAYLEATTPRSRTLYERFGFETTGELHLDGGPTLWCMWRQPSLR